MRNTELQDLLTVKAGSMSGRGGRFNREESFLKLNLQRPLITGKGVGGESHKILLKGLRIQLG